MRKNGVWQVALWDRIRMRPGIGCWEWQKSFTKSGYATFTKDGKQYYSHRLAWESANGPIPDGLDILHLCDNKKCCRPDHLKPGTHAENMADMKAKGRAFRMIGEQHINHILSSNDVLKMRALRKETIPVKALAKSFCVSVSTIEKILSGHLWKHLN